MMALEERRIAREEIPIHQRIKGDDIPTDQFSDPFPVGMRVLAVDDDATCLRVLEGKLRTCQYHVTTATHALTALKMLRENKDNFDIVISDVEMPDMDGFKLLELVGLEMDLPVIMLSAHSDTKSVMKGVTHGACDYLLKPVRVEELKNIWQHVIRKKFDAKDSNNSENSEKPRQGTFEGGQGSASGQTDQNGKFNRKRKDQYDDDDDDEESGDGQENEDPSAQKKPRVVWSVDLHRKFVSAVNQLGVDKAVPKKILDLMNVDKLTRENVASHLQKYRLYMKRLSSVANHQANMMASLAGKDPSYLRMSSFDGLGDFHALTTAAALPNAIGSYPPGAMLGRLNTPAALAFNGISAGMVQPGHASIPNNSLSDLGKLQSISLPGNQSGNLLNGMPIAMELDQLQHNKSASHIVDFSTAIDDSSLYPLAASFQNPGIFEAGVGVASQVLDHGRSNENWQGSGSLTRFSSNSLPSSDPFPQVNFPRINVTAQFSPITSRIRCNQHDISSTSALRDAQHQSSSAVFGMQQETLKQPNFGSTSNRVGHTVNYSMQLNQANSVAFSALQDNLKATNFGSASNRGALNSSNSAPAINEGLCPLGQNFGKDKAVSSRRDPALINQSDSVTPFMQQSRFEKLPLGASVGSKGGHHMDQTKTQSGFVTNSSGTLEDLMNAMVKQEHGELLMDEGIGCSNYSVRTCI